MRSNTKRLLKTSYGGCSYNVDSLIPKCFTLSSFRFLMGDSREYFRVDNNVIAGMNGATQQWGTVKNVPNNYYQYGEWKVEDKKPIVKTQQMRPMSTIDVKHVAQIQIPQTVTQQNTWGGGPPTG